MNFSYHYLGYLTAGQTISVKLNQQAHVALLTTQNLHRYAHQQIFRHYGKLQSYTEDYYHIPSSGNWHLIICSNTKIPNISSRVARRNFPKK